MNGNWKGGYPKILARELSNLVPHPPLWIQEAANQLKIVAMGSVDVIVYNDTHPLASSVFSV